MYTPTVGDTHVLLLVENPAVVYIWHKLMSPHCEYVSLITQSLHLIEAMLPCRIYVEHLTRCSSPQSILVHQLSWTSTTHERVLQEIRHLRLHTPAGLLINWLKDPTADWKLPKNIVDYVINNVLPHPKPVNHYVSVKIKRKTLKQDPNNLLFIWLLACPSPSRGVSRGGGVG